jgi:CheY-like chemotaxis protein
MKDTSSRNASAPARILLVDDNKLGLVARKSVLEELGCHVTTASDGEEAIERFARGNFDLVITDYKMPKMDGLEFIKRVRQRSPGVPIILISGYAEALGLAEANTSADVVIQKSATEVPHLIRSVQRLLRRPAPKKPAASHRAAARAGSGSGGKSV